MGRSGRVRSLFIQAFGHRNLVPCSACENQYLMIRIGSGDEA
jgi:hypothetical protein